MTALNELSLVEAAAMIAAGSIRPSDLVEQCLERIATREPAVLAFEFIDPDAVRAAARALDSEPPRGPLHGIPVGIKDIIDTVDMPTGWGSPIYAGHRPPRDAGCVALLRSAGAVVMGKTVSTEFAFLHPGKTRNPRNPDHTPGGSSQGSAAAVADCMLPLALGTQTAASVIRPAAFCGVVGYKSSHGAFDLGGICSLSQSMDALGFFVRHAADLVPVRQVLAGAAPVSRPFAGPRPVVGIARTQHWQQTSAETRALVDGIAGDLDTGDAEVSEVEVGPADGSLTDAQMTVMAFEVARSRHHEMACHSDRVSAEMHALVDAGRRTSHAAWRDALALARDWRDRLDDIFSRVDVVLAPSALGEAPAGLHSTGDGLMSRMWNLLGVPSVTLPAGLGPVGLPLGIQLIGRHGHDDALIAAAVWLEERLRDR
jgi:Asp-tRNA(Asn)/Glu-tRNA(Gln) amidotransferase A subunit family amidase